MTFRSQNQYLDLVINWLEIQNDHIWRPQRVFIDLRHDFGWWSKIEFKSQPCLRNDFLESKSIPRPCHQLVSNPKWPCLETPKGIYWPPVRYYMTPYMTLEDWFQIAPMNWHWSLEYNKEGVEGDGKGRGKGDGRKNIDAWNLLYHDKEIQRHKIYTMHEIKLKFEKCVIAVGVGRGLGREWVGKGLVMEQRSLHQSHIIWLICYYVCILWMIVLTCNLSAFKGHCS